MIHIIYLLYKCRSGTHIRRSICNIQTYMQYRSVNSLFIRNLHRNTRLHQFIERSRHNAPKRVYGTCMWPNLTWNTENLEFNAIKLRLFDYYSQKVSEAETLPIRRYYYNRLLAQNIDYTKNKINDKFEMRYNIPYRMPTSMIESTNIALQENNLEVGRNPYDISLTDAITNFDLFYKTNVKSIYILNKPVIIKIESFQDYYKDIISKYLNIVTQLANNDITTWCLKNKVAYGEVEFEMVMRYINMHLVHGTWELRTIFESSNVLYTNTDYKNMLLKDWDTIQITILLSNNYLGNNNH